MIRILLLIILPFAALAQSIDKSILEKPWKAVWITGPGEEFNIWTPASAVPESVKQYQVLKFRKDFDLTSKPSSFVIHVSADNRYKLYVNGTLVSLGPARGDTFNWNFETVDIAQYLVAGRNCLAALVWNEGVGRPEAQVSLMTAFILQGNTDAESVVNTDKTWKVIRDEGYQPLRPRTTGYYVAGQGEFITMSKTVKDFEKPTFDDSSWPAPRTMQPGIPKGVFTFASITWMLVPSKLPQMELHPEDPVKIRKAEGIKMPAGFPITIPANTSATLLIDNGALTNAYVSLHLQNGKDAALSVAYAEALYVKGNEVKNKGNRNEIDGKIFIGRRDSLISDGSMYQRFTSLWYRTYRYIQVKVKTTDQPLILSNFYSEFTGYPFELTSSMTTPNQSVQKNLEIGWRTARLCATETYMDCPYYEQLQYFGDTRIQALVTLYNSKDDRLVRSAIVQGDQSRLAEGVTMSRYPTAQTQIIPGFSLWWIGMVHDYWMYRNDTEFVKQRLPGTRQVLSFFEKYQQPDGSLKNLPYWRFSDWVDSNGWKDGVAPLGTNGNSSILDIQLLWTYKIAAELELRIGIKELAQSYTKHAEQLAATIREKYWDGTKQMYADTPEKDLFSQHANSLAILAGLVTGPEAKTLASKIITDASLAPASIYFKYYLHQAATKAGLGNDYIKWLDKWNENIKMGLTTWAEMSDVDGSRSDCHAWGSSPNIEFYRIVLGIDSSEPGFGKVKIEPHLSDITDIKGSIPHPKGDIAVSYLKDKKGKWLVSAELPATVTGTFVWNGKSYPLNSGKNNIDVNQ
ncbi:MAG TPA: alpha-L-rhamnosidase C-terminal domain-containing protein [Cyclobacteriaceae bacterium]|nr:alpha-L-rhamnosidase C-terminal domain-containing protein [Cyclobacteriaceae bacterium]